MAKEIKAAGLNAGTNYFAVVEDASGNYWTGTGNNFAAASGITWSAAGIALTADATITRDFAGDFPAAITTAAEYIVKIYSRAGGSPAVTDVQGTPAATGKLSWDGAAEITDVSGTRRVDARKWVGGTIPVPVVTGVPTVDLGRLRKLVTAQGGSLSTITFDALASSTNQQYRGYRVVIPDGYGNTGAGQSRIITDYNGTTKVATIFPNWTVAPDNTTQFYLESASSDLQMIVSNTNATTLAAGLLNVNSPTTSATVVITPILSTLSNPRFSTADLLEVPQYSAPSDAWTLVDSNGAAVNLGTNTVRLVGYRDTENVVDNPFDNTEAAAFKYETGGSGLVVSGAGTNTNVVTLTHSTNTTSTIGDFRYWLWDISRNLVLAKGRLPIVPAVKQYP